MKIRHVQEQHPPNGLPPPGLFIAHFRDAASVMLRYLSTEQTPGQGQEVRPMGSLVSEAASGRCDGFFTPCVARCLSSMPFFIKGECIGCSTPYRRNIVRRALTRALAMVNGVGSP